MDEEIKYLPNQKIQKLLTFIKSQSLRDYAIFLCSYNHGLRVSEVGRLKVGDYTKDSKRLYIRRVKGGISATYKISDELIKTLDLWLKLRNLNNLVPLSEFREEPLFISRGSGRKPLDDSLGISRRQLDTLIKFYISKGNFEKEIDKDKRHFHVLRHSCAVFMISQKVPIIQVQDWLGHRNINSTMVYAKVVSEVRDESSKVWDKVNKINEELKKKQINGKVNWKGDKK